MHIAAFLPLAVLPLALAASHDVQVGVDKDGKPGLYYTPDNLKPAKGDTVVFTFNSDTHSVAQSNFDDPCVYLDKGIYSGFPGKVSPLSIVELDLSTPRPLTGAIVPSEEKLIRHDYTGQDFYHHRQ